MTCESDNIVSLASCFPLCGWSNQVCNCISPDIEACSSSDKGEDCCALETGFQSDISLTVRNFTDFMNPQSAWLYWCLLRAKWMKWISSHTFLLLSSDLMHMACLFFSGFLTKSVDLFPLPHAVLHWLDHLNNNWRKDALLSCSLRKFLAYGTLFLLSPNILLNILNVIYCRKFRLFC
jgi:hypothetical protein